MHTVTILMSTYNGQKYLREQLDSLLNQQDVSLRIIVRDDGSRDNTLKILAEYQKVDSTLCVLSEQNCGAEESFNRLCRYALTVEKTDYYAFCDQDDVWDKNKLKIAIDNLKNFEDLYPNLYFSNLKMVNERLEYIKDFYSENEVFTDKRKTLVQVFAYGCTCVFNRKALEMYCGVKSQKVFHDNWIYAVCSYMGHIVYDPVGHILYRQHDKNLSGHKSNGFSLIYQRFKCAFHGHLGHTFENMAIQLMYYQSEINEEDFKLIKHVASYRKKLMSKLYLLCATGFSTKSWFKNICIKYRILFNGL